MAKIREKMCGKKASFQTKKAAELRASLFNQRVYECPICFCWHCTSKEDWRSEYYTESDVEKKVNDAKAEANKKIKTLNTSMNYLKKEIAELRKENNKLSQEVIKNSKLRNIKTKGV